MDESHPLYRLKQLATILRENCPWDKEQTSMTLRPYLIEESYELFDAIEKDDIAHLKEELGDVLYQIYAHCAIAAEQNLFDIDDVADGIIKKLVYRHPHIFGDEKVKDKDEVLSAWEKIKKKEKAHRESILDGVPRHLPGLLRAYRVQQKASRIGFDWERIENVIDKLDEEISEFKNELKKNDMKGASEEAGDILFTFVNLFRFMKINPEEALTTTTNKFIKRFRFVETEAAKAGKELADMSLEEMDAIWDRAKKED